MEFTVLLPLEYYSGTGAHFVDLSAHVAYKRESNGAKDLERII